MERLQCNLVGCSTIYLETYPKESSNFNYKIIRKSCKYTQPAIDSLFKLKDKIKNTPNELDDYCFNQGVSAIETFANYLLEVAKELRK